MPHVVHAIEIKASPEQVWTVLGDLSSVRYWQPGVASVRLRGTARYVRLADGGELIDEIRYLSDEHASYSFRQVSGPWPVRGLCCTFAVSAIGDGATFVLLNATFEAEPEPAEQVEATLIGSLEALRRWIERGERWDA